MSDLEIKPIICRMVSFLGRLVKVRQGVIFLFPGRGIEFRRKTYLGPYLALMGVLVHPAVAANFGSSYSIFVGLLILVLAAPLFLRLVLAPFVAILLAGVVSSAYFQSVDFIKSAIVGYFVFFLIYYRAPAVHSLLNFILCMVALVAAFQVFFGFHWASIHVPTTESHHLNVARPPSIFPASVFVTQFQLFAVSVGFFLRKKSVKFFLLNGVTAALSGATGGYAVMTFLALLDFKKGALAIMSFLLVVALISAAAPWTLIYNHSFETVYGSIASRVPVFSDNSSRGLSQIVGETGYQAFFNSMQMQRPSLLAVLEVLSLGGVVFFCCVVMSIKASLVVIIRLVSATGAILLTQLLHPNFGSVFFGLFFGSLLALSWWLIQALQESK